MRYTTTVGQKFNADGTVRPFQGNTILCMINPSVPTYERVERLQQNFTLQPFAKQVVLLPPSSFHMTVMDLVCDEVRDPADCSRFLEPTISLSEVDAFFSRVLKAVAPPATLRMKYSGLSTSGGLRIDVAPADTATHHTIWECCHRYRGAPAHP